MLLKHCDLISSFFPRSFYPVSSPPASFFILPTLVGKENFNFYLDLGLDFIPDLSSFRTVPFRLLFVLISCVPAADYP